MAGHPRNIKTPEKMWEIYLAYKNDTKANPRKKMVFVGKDGDQRKEELERPLTFEGFKNWCYDTVGVIEQYFTNQDGLYEEYIGVCSRIKGDIRQDQIEGGMVGQYNASITQRLNGLADNTNNNINFERPIFTRIDLDVPENNGTGKDIEAEKEG